MRTSERAYIWARLRRQRHSRRKSASLAIIQLLSPPASPLAPAHPSLLLILDDDGQGPPQRLRIGSRHRPDGVPRIVGLHEHDRAIGSVVEGPNDRHVVEARDPVMVVEDPFIAERLIDLESASPARIPAADRKSV